MVYNVNQLSLKFEFPLSCFFLKFYKHMFSANIHNCENNNNDNNCKPFVNHYLSRLTKRIITKFFE